ERVVVRLQEDAEELLRERDAAVSRNRRIEDQLRRRDTFIVHLESLQQRGWRVLVKSHEYTIRDAELRSVQKGAWGWLVTVMPIDRQRYARWQTLTGAVMSTLEDALGDTERRVRH